MKPAEFAEISRAIHLHGAALYLLVDLWEAAIKTRVERFKAFPTEGESEMIAVLKKLEEL